MLPKKQTQLLWEDYFKKKGKAWFKVRSGSMSPMIPIGARVFVKRCHFEDVRLFDLVVFKSKGNFIIHRVLKKKKNHLLQSGDNFSSPFLIHKGCILGRVEVIEVSSYIIDLEKKKIFFFNIIISVLCILAQKMPNHKYLLSRLKSKFIKLTMRR